MLIVNTRDSVMFDNTVDSLLMLTNTSGGVSETLEKADTVMARASPASNVVTTVTPLGQHESAALKSSVDTVTIHLHD